jgi:hypothetical protein
MKTLLLAILSLCFALSVVALAQDPPNQAPRKTQAAAGGSADNHHGHNSGRWRQIEVRNRPKSLECGQSGDP